MQVLGPLWAAIQGATSQGVLWGIMAIGVFLTYRILDFSDLTVDGSFALGGMLSATLIAGGGNPFVSLFFAVLAGAAAGLVTGLLNTKLEIPPILSSILTMIALYSINMRVAGGSPNVPLMKSETVFTMLEKVLPFSKNTVALINGLVISIIIVVILYWFFGTEIGSAIRATGNNESMARALGVNTDAMKLIGLMISNGLVALSGALVAQSERVANVTMGTGTMVIGLASVVIGGIIVSNKLNFSIRMFSAVIGSVIYRIIIATVLQLGLKTDDQKLLTAIIVAVALSVPTITEKINVKKNGREAKKC